MRTRSWAAVGSVLSAAAASACRALLWLSAVPVAAFAFFVAVKASDQEEAAAVTVDLSAPVSNAARAAALRDSGGELLTAAGDAVPPTATLSGHWIAEVSMSDSTPVGLVIDLDTLGSRWVGEFDVSEFGIDNYPVEVTLSAPTVKLHLAGPDAEFEGTLSEDGASLSGVLKFGDDLFRSELRRTGGPQFSQTFLQLEAAADDPKLVESLASDARLRRRFNADRSKVRLLMLLSPT